MKQHLFPLLMLLFLLASASVIARQDQIPKNEISLVTLESFRPVAENWSIAEDVFYDIKSGKKSKVTPGFGILVNAPTDKNQDHLMTKMEHGDIELELEFMMAPGSNAGVYLQGRYEIQLFDSWGVEKPKFSDCGGIYQRWDESRPEGRKGYEGHAPAINVSKAPGLWQHFKIVFKAPRFNKKGEKTANAVFVQVVHNGTTIHENVSVSGPTRAAAFDDEQPLGPLMIQGDHGPVAIRNIKYKAYGTEPVTLSNLSLKSFEGKYKSIENLKAMEPVRTQAIDFIAHQGSGTKDNFGGIITGNLEVPRSGEYVFNLKLDWIPDDNRPDNPNGMGELIVEGKRLIFIDGKIGNAMAKTDLEAGNHPISLAYFKEFGYWYAQSTNITLSLEGPGVPLTALNQPLVAAEPVGAINVLVENKPVVLRGFLNHLEEKKTHAISVGEPGSVNYALDLETGTFLQLWRGNFLETTPMWHGRGETQLGLPLGNVITFSGKPTLAFQKENVAWPETNNGYEYIGYELDPMGRPSFKYKLGTASVTENLTPEDGGKKLTHALAIDMGQEKEPIFCKVAEGDKIVKLPNGLYAINDKQYYVELPAKSKPVLRTTPQNTMELLLPVKTENNAGTVKYSIVW